MDIDKQRIDAVRMLQALGYTYQGGEWLLTYRGGEWLAPAGAVRMPPRRYRSWPRLTP